MMKLNDELKNNTPFKVPEGYFETLTERMMTAVSDSHGQDQSGEDAVNPSRRVMLRPFIALAAAIVGFAIVATVMIRLVSSDRLSGPFEKGNGMYAELAAEELDTYMIEYELIRAGTDGMVLPEEEEISSEAIIDYLMMEDIDINDIYELL